MSGRQVLLVEEGGHTIAVPRRSIAWVRSLPGGGCEVTVAGMGPVRVAGTIGEVRRTLAAVAA